MLTAASIHIIRKFLAVSILAGIFLSGCATVPREGKVQEVALQELCDRYQIEMQWDSISQVVTLTDGQIKARILVGSEVVVVEEERVALSASVRRVKNILMVPVDFEEKIIKRFKVAAPVFKFRKIVVDAGHGGKDPGAIGRSGVKEKDVVLQVSRALRDILANNGVDVIMTRDKDEFITLEGRTEIASRSKADLFVSIHANANPSKNLAGLEIYYLEDLSTKDKKEEQRLKNHDILFGELAMDQGVTDLEKIIADLLFTHKQRESPALADNFAKSIADAVGMVNRGDKTARFFVLRNTLVPAVLIEMGYLSNAQEEKLLSSADYQQRLAGGIAQAILEYGKK